MNSIFDHASEQLGAKSFFMTSMKKHSINWKVTKSYTHWQNQAEDGIQRIKLDGSTLCEELATHPDYGTVE